MFNSKTVFVLGAGASHEFGFPLGSLLLKKIAGKMDLGYDTIGRLEGPGDKQLLVAAGHFESTDVLEAAGKLRRGLPLRKSVDDFLDIHRDDKVVVTLGKSAIVKCIREAEAESPLFLENGRPVDFSRIENTWLVKLSQMMGRVGPEALANHSTFINFNYDRSLEFFFAHAFQALYGYSQLDACQTVDRMQIYRPYGSVGKTEASDVLASFGHKISDADCIKSSSQIRTYTEDLEGSRVVAQIVSALMQMDRIIFLGFGFHQQNIQLMTPPEKLPARQVIATTLGISGHETDALRTRVSGMFSGLPGFVSYGVKCAELFEENTIRFSQM